MFLRSLRRGRVALLGAFSGAIPLATSLLLAGPALADNPELREASPRAALTRPHEPLFGGLTPPLPDMSEFPRQLVSDDNSAESDFGVVGADSVPFMWFNRFSPAPPFSLEQMWVLFPQDSTLAGAAVQLAIYQDTDGDPTNGAQLLATIDETVQENDGLTFSVYDIEPPVEVTAGDLYLGVISRYAETPTPPTFPATLDTSSSAGRSWVALWTGNPPTPPDLPGDDETFLIDDVVPGGGNFLIRGFGQDGGTVVDVPALEETGLAALTLLLITTGVLLMLRRRLVTGPVKR